MNFIFDIKIQLSGQKPTQIFVDKVIKAVAGGIVGQVFFQDRTVLVLFGRILNFKLLFEVGRNLSIENRLDRFGVQVAFQFPRTPFEK